MVDRGLIDGAFVEAQEHRQGSHRRPHHSHPRHPSTFTSSGYATFHAVSLTFILVKPDPSETGTESTRQVD